MAMDGDQLGCVIGCGLAADSRTHLGFDFGKVLLYPVDMGLMLIG